MIYYLPILSILLQSCMAYHTNSVSLSQAANQGKIKMVAEAGQVYKFDNIALRDSVYYGLGREYLDNYAYIAHNEASTPLDSTKIEAIYTKDVKKSKRKTAWLVSLPVAYIVLVLIFSAF